MAFTNQQIIDYLLANPKLTDPQIVDAMKQFAITPAQLASAVGLSEGAILSRVAATIPNGSSLILGDMVIVPQYRVTGSGETQEIGGLESFFTSKTNGDPNYKAPVGTEMRQYGADGAFQQTLKTKKELSFFGGIVDMLKDPVVLAAIGGAAAGGLLGGAGALGNAATVGATGLTAGEIAALTAGDLAIGGGALAGTAPLTAAQIAALTATDLAIGAGTPSAASTAGLLSPAVTSAVAPTVAGTTAGGVGSTVAGMGAGTGLTAAGAGGLGGATGAAGLGGSLGTGLTTAGAAGLGGLTGAAGLGGSLGAGLTTAGGLVGANTLLGGAGLGTTLAGLGAGVGGSLLGAATGLGAGNLANLLSGGLGTAGSLLQMQQSKEAALAAQQRIDAETAAAKQAAQFRPIGMTTRFGTSQFQTDPVTGQLTSAGYTLSPEAKNAQDRFITLAGQGLTQAEGAQKAFEPLQTGAQSLFKLGQGYLAETPEAVAANYLKSQMALLQPGRDLELANIETRLRNQGRLGLSVAQGGNLGAASPELQALYNARARQEAELAANAQQLGQRDVLFGSSLLGQGAQTMGNYYGGQQQAYAPYTTALGQVQGLETAAQQPLTMGLALGKEASQAGARVGELGLGGARLSTALGTSANATTNPYAQALMAAGNPNAMFGQSLGNVFGGLFS